MADWFGGWFGEPETIDDLVVDNVIVSPIVIGDDYLEINGRQFAFTIPDIANVSVGTAKIYFEGRHRYRCRHSWSVEGTLTKPIAGYMLLTFSLPGSATAALDDGEYITNVSIEDDNGNLITPAALMDRPVELVYGRGAEDSCDC